jgi:hypothetical protein
MRVPIQLSAMVDAECDRGGLPGLDPSGISGRSHRRNVPTMVVRGGEVFVPPAPSRSATIGGARLTLRRGRRHVKRECIREPLDARNGPEPKRVWRGGCPSG